MANEAEDLSLLEEVSAFFGLGLGSIDDADDLYFTRFQQSHHAECQPRRRSFRDWGRDCVCPSGKDNLCGHRFDKQYGELPNKVGL